MSASGVVRSIDYGERGTVYILPDAEALAWKAATSAVELLAAASNQNGASYLALSGGSTPKRMGQILAQPAFRDLEVWQRMHVFWGDERWVPLTDQESNAGEAKRSFLDAASIPPDQVYPVPTDAESPAAGACEYANQVQLIVPDNEGLPQFDLIFLGMGDDGHTASLFPHTDALTERKNLVVANAVPKLETTRITMTAPLLNNGRDVVFLVGGAGKRQVLADVLEGPERPEDFPSQLIRPFNGTLSWFVDESAASELKRT